ncbi:hypothetical protein BGZ72_003549 [Mortierella alpina]|nr:hypothetical protein BGZ72_003549 [Mortierella alpina]
MKMMNVMNGIFEYLKVYPAAATFFNGVSDIKDVNVYEEEDGTRYVWIQHVLGSSMCLTYYDSYVLLNSYDQVGAVVDRGTVNYKAENWLYLENAVLKHLEVNRKPNGLKKLSKQKKDKRESGTDGGHGKLSRQRQLGRQPRVQ